MIAVAVLYRWPYGYITSHNSVWLCRDGNSTDISHSVLATKVYCQLTCVPCSQFDLPSHDDSFTATGRSRKNFYSPKTNLDSISCEETLNNNCLRISYPRTHVTYERTIKTPNVDICADTNFLFGVR